MHQNETANDLAKGLGELLSYEGNVEEDFYLSFQVLQEEMGVVRSFNLKPGGDKIPVNNHNRKGGVARQFRRLLPRLPQRLCVQCTHGQWCEAVECLVCGSPDLDMTALQRAAQYEGFTETDPTVRAFCEAPVSHTCFNQICLPPYRSRKALRHKLTIAISNAEGFGLE
ncbi:unnamed protein product [Arctogadus glacialis]